VKRPVSACLLALCACWSPLHAADAAAGNEPAPIEAVDVMAAARTADLAFQRHLELTYADLASGDQERIIPAIRNLGHLDVMESVPQLLEFADGYHQPAPILIATTETLADLQAVGAIGQLQKLLDHNDANVRAAAQKALTRLESMSNAQYLQRGKDSDDAIRASAVTSLGAMEAQDAGDLLSNALRYDESAHIRRMAAIGLGRLGDATRVDVLIEALTDSNPGVRERAAEALAKLNAVKAIPFLLMGLEGNVSTPAINRALIKLSGEDFGFIPGGNVIDRHNAIEHGFEWWAANAKRLSE
jgi:HEAT repeat protein